MSTQSRQLVDLNIIIFENISKGNMKFNPLETGDFNLKILMFLWRKKKMSILECSFFYCEKKNSKIN